MIREVAAKGYQGWATPLSLYVPLAELYGFDTDVCAEPWSAKCESYFTQEDDGLAQEWGQSNWLNPPYKQIYRWLEKAWEEADKGKFTCCLLPANTDTAWYHDFGWAAENHFIKGRVKFELPPGIVLVDDKGKPKKANSPAFPSLLLLIGPEVEFGCRRRLTNKGEYLE